MGKKFYELAWGGVLSSLTALTLIVSPLFAGGTLVQEQNKSSKAVAANNWQEFRSVCGKCKMMFPKYPDHLSEKMRLSQEGFDLKYDAYISAADHQTLFLLLIAQYPDFVDEAYAKTSLESFLNGILTHNPDNQLIFADLSLVDGHEALDFFIRTAGVYFKGRALMVKNSLYLMAMECEVQNYDEMSYNTFVNSFKLAKN
ncbi:MAG TPA: hypothetical protein VGJ00_00235 [Rhabdochlamydiaceae bacterium]|jgi:hypothetical protein